MDNSRDLSFESSHEHNIHLKLGEMLEFVGRGTPDGLFLERLDAFMDKCLADIKAFSERELCPFEKTRQYVAEWHSRYLFQPQASSLGQPPDNGRASKVRAVLCDTSRILESLSETSGVQSFLLAVDPSEPSDGGFLGGSVSGREFWRGLRSGGEAGAKSFKLHCLQGSRFPATTSFSREESVPARISSPSRSSVSLKNELYETVRKALRSASGIRNAEMKWTNPERLDIYGVRLVGWPPNIPSQNPSSLKVNQNKELLDCLKNGTMRLELIKPPGSAEEHDDSVNNTNAGSGQTSAMVTEDFSWAYNADGGDHKPDASPTEQFWHTKTFPRTDTTAASRSTDHDQSDIFVTRSSQTIWHHPQHSRKRARNDELEAEVE